MSTYVDRLTFLESHFGMTPTRDFPENRHDDRWPTDDVVTGVIIFPEDLAPQSVLDALGVPPKPRKPNREPCPTCGGTGHWTPPPTIDVHPLVTISVGAVATATALAVLWLTYRLLFGG